jgi:hypothetical protein
MLKKPIMSDIIYYKKVTENNGYYEMGSVNWYNLTSILEDLYVENAELKARVEALENDKNQWCHPESGVAIAQDYRNNLGL